MESDGVRRSAERTDLSDNLIVLENTPRNSHRVVVPVRPGHVGVDIGVDARHFDDL